MPSDLTILTEDRITGQVAPCGFITGFPQPSYKSPWPSGLVGKPLTDRRIAWYAKQGRSVEQRKRKKTKKVKLNLSDV